LAWGCEGKGQAAADEFFDAVHEVPDQDADGVFRIARRVAKDRIISTVDPDARHGHKTSARGFDGYKGHVSADPDSEVIIATTVTAGNIGDGQAVKELLADELAEVNDPDAPEGPVSAYGDCAYGAGHVLDTLEQGGIEIMCKVQTPSAPAGRFAKDAFQIDLDAGTVTCPAEQSTPLRKVKNGHIAHFATVCTGCPLKDHCTTSSSGRSIHVGEYEQQLARARARQANPAWKTDYTATRPKVERKIAHLMRRKHGGRRARAAQRSTPTSRSWLPRPTSHASPCSGSHPHQADRPRIPPEDPGPGQNHPRNASHRAVPRPENDPTAQNRCPNPTPAGSRAAEIAPIDRRHQPHKGRSTPVF
jgi:hypothetical protein